MVMSNGLVNRDNSLNIGMLGAGNTIIPVVNTAEDKAAVTEGWQRGCLIGANPGSWGRYPGRRFGQHLRDLSRWRDRNDTA